MEQGRRSSKKWTGLLMLSLFFTPLSLLLTTNCQKIEYTTLESPAYLRVFNSINYYQGMEFKNDTSTYLCMLINPAFDSEGIPISAETVGDFLDVRNTYAPPYPSHVGISTSRANPEYPGKENVLAAPVMNGFDLSSWAQVPSGRMRFVFMYRPKDEVKFFDLPAREKKSVLVDTTIQLDAQEVYTMQLVLKDFNTRKKGIIIRQENFHKQALSDSLVYVNFYNYSADGYWQAPIDIKQPTGLRLTNNFTQGIRDTMNVFLSLFQNQEYTNVWGPDYMNLSYAAKTISSDYTNRYLMTLYRDIRSGKANPYFSFPLWATGAGNGIHTGIWESFTFLAPGMTMTYYPITDREYESISPWLNGGILASLNCLNTGNSKMKLQEPYVMDNGFETYKVHTGFIAPNLIVSTHSGQYNPRSFATVNSIEVINGKVYLTTIQRKYEAPAY